MKFARCLGSVFLLASATAPIQAFSAQLQGQSLVDALRQGGYVIVLRHADTDKARSDQPHVDLANCDTQRVLTPKGRAAARTMGGAIDALKIPIGQVSSSPLCRTMWTGDLAFGHADPNPGLLEPKPKNAANAAKAAAVLRPLIGAVPKSATNSVIVTHGFNVKSITGFQPAEGEAVISSRTETVSLRLLVGCYRRSGLASLSNEKGAHLGLAPTAVVDTRRFVSAPDSER